jgi:hypothetical protein
MNVSPKLDCFQARYRLGNSVYHIPMAQAWLGHIRIYVRDLYPVETGTGFSGVRVFFQS